MQPSPFAFTRSSASALLFVLVLVPVARPGAAQSPQQTLDEHVIVTATATAIEFPDVARAVTVITREQIERLPARSVADVLRLAAGVAVQARGDGGVQTDFSIRGASFAQTLVLIDGVRLNNAQSGHHNGDFPVTLDQVERIEIMPGAGSSLHGADALGGTINVITRPSTGGPRLQVTGGEFGTLEASASGTADTGRARHVVAAAVGHSDGFMFARDSDMLTTSVRSALGPRTTLFAGVTTKAFGANGFYGPSPSKEWTNQLLTSASHTRALPLGWELRMGASYGTHGDRFLYDVRQPGVSENRHRTHAVSANVLASRAWGTALHLSIGAEGAGDWLYSSNLGDRSATREGVYAEGRWGPIQTVTLVASARVDHYASFGIAASPALAAGWRATPRIKLRGAIGRAFRVPTFTELYYRDPNHQASGALEPERSVDAEAGIDWQPSRRWQTRATVFQRRDRDVIDWVRPSAQVRWTTTNVRRARTNGLEIGAERAAGGPADAFFGVQYVWLQVRPEGLDLLSKYLLEYSRHAVIGTASARLPFGLAWGQRVEYRSRYDGQRYWLADARLSRRVGRVEVHLEGSNLLNEQYEEIAGVAAAPRWIAAGLTVH